MAHFMLGVQAARRRPSNMKAMQWLQHATHMAPRQVCAALGHNSRYYSNVRLDANAEDVAELMDRHLQKGSDRQSGQAIVGSTRRDALHLYRKIQRYTLLFDWADDTGELWRDKLRRSAREEFEAARFEKDPRVTTQLLLTSSEAVEQLMERFVRKRRELEEAGKLPKRLTNPYAKHYDL